MKKIEIPVDLYYELLSYLKEDQRLKVKGGDSSLSLLQAFEFLDKHLHAKDANLAIKLQDIGRKQGAY